MKSIKQLSFIGLATLLVLSSCTMEKRVYMSGYHIEWKKSTHNLDRQELVSNDGKLAEQNQIGTVEQSENENKKIDNAASVNDNSLTASVDNSVIIPSRKTVSFSKKENTVTAKTNLTSEIKTVVKLDSKKNKKANKKSGGDVPKVLLYVLCFLMPWLAVGLATDWDIKKVIYNLLWTLLCGIPGIIHAIIIVSKSK